MVFLTFLSFILTFFRAAADKKLVQRKRYLNTLAKKFACKIFANICFLIFQQWQPAEKINFPFPVARELKPNSVARLPMMKFVRR